MIFWSILLGLLAGSGDGFLIPALHWPPLLSFFCAILVFWRPAGSRLGVWIFIVISGLWLDLAWMVPFGIFIIWHAFIYALTLSLGRRAGPVVLLYLVSFIYFLGLGGWELILGRGSDVGLVAAGVGAFVTGTGAVLARGTLRRIGRLSRRWFFIKTG